MPLFLNPRSSDRAINILHDFRLLHMALAAVAFTGAATAQTAANAFLDDTQVQVINVTMAPSDWTALQQNYLLDTYYHASMTWNGSSVAFGIRSHGGNGSRSPIKPNLDFNFAHYSASQTFLGLSFVILKANNEDPSDLHEWISMKLYRAMGLPAPREAPAQLFINGQLLGFYYIVEHEDDAFVQRDFGEDGGYLYEWEYGQEYEFGNLGTDPNSYAAFLDLKSDQTSPDLQTFVNFIQAVNAPASSETSYITGLSAYMNPKLFLTYCATENVLTDIDGVLDGISGLNNFYLYQFQNSTLYQMIAWDKDRTFSDPNRSILDGVTTGTNINILAQTLYGFADYKNVYLSELTRAATLLGGAGGWADSEITREWGVISAAALNDPNKQCDYSGAGPVPCGTEDTVAGVEAMHTYLAQRSSVVQSSAASDGYQPIATNPQIQTVSLSPGYTVLQLSPGALAAAFGTNLGPATPASSPPLPRIAGQTFVAVDGVRAPLLTTSAGEIGFQIPEDEASGVVANVVVSVGGAMSNSQAVDIWATSPGILAVARANGSVVAAGNAPAANEVVTIYAIGLGPVTPDVPIGGTPPANSVATTIVTPQLTLGSAPMTVLFSGLAPGFVGLYQVNAQMPATLPQGASAQLTLAADGATAVMQLALQ
jgi:uncharacterized protein (TIGR03437 family)